MSERRPETHLNWNSPWCSRLDLPGSHAHATEVSSIVQSENPLLHTGMRFKTRLWLAVHVKDAYQAISGPNHGFG